MAWPHGLDLTPALFVSRGGEMQFRHVPDAGGGAAVFRCPDPSTSSSRSPTVTVSSESVNAVKLRESSLLMRTKQAIVRCNLNMSAQVEGVKRELISREFMPLGMDPKALLRMLDMQGED